jgi:hypothetical protein
MNVLHVNRLNGTPNAHNAKAPPEYSARISKIKTKKVANKYLPDGVMCIYRLKCPKYRRHNYKGDAAHVN